MLFIANRMISMKINRFIIKYGTKLQKYGFICSFRQSCISNFVSPIENHASCSFQKHILLFPKSEIINIIYYNSLIFYQLNYIYPTLLPPVFSKHGIQNHLPTFVKRNPVVRKNRIGCMRLLGILNNQYVNAIRT